MARNHRKNNSGLYRFSNKLAEKLIEDDDDDTFRDSIYNFNRMGKSKMKARSKFFDPKKDED